MFDPVVRRIRTVAPSLLPDVKFAIGAFKRLMRTSRVWRWTKAKITPEGAEYTIVYLGTDARKDAAVLAMRRKAVDPMLEGGVITVSEFPMRNALRVPQYLDMDVPLDRPLEEILADYGEKLRRVVLQQLPHAEMIEATTSDE